MKPTVHPAPDLAAKQAAWLAPARARLLRRVGVARRRRVLDLGGGYGVVTPELVRRCSGKVVALDRDARSLAAGGDSFQGACRICGDATLMPFGDGTFELVFCQFALMWMNLAAAVRQIKRVLRPGGVLAAVEPDYGGMIEHPQQIATAPLWTSALTRAGADPRAGRKLPGLLTEAGLEVRVDFLDRLTEPSCARFELLRGLPLTAEEQRALERIEAADAVCGHGLRVVHLPVFLITAELL